MCYRPDECQIITAGTDRKIGYWETYDASQIRELEGSKLASINGMDMYGKQFVTGGGDKLVKVGARDYKSYTEKNTCHEPSFLCTIQFRSTSIEGGLVLAIAIIYRDSHFNFFYPTKMSLYMIHSELFYKGRCF